MDCSMVMEKNRIKRVEISDCAHKYGFRIIARGTIPKKKTNDLSLLLKDLLDKDRIPIENELVEFKKKWRKEGLWVFEHRYYNIEYLAQLNALLGIGEVYAMTIEMHVIRNPKWWFMKH